MRAICFFLVPLQKRGYGKNEVVHRFIDLLRVSVTKNELNEKPGAFLVYKVPTHGIVKRWG